MPGEEDYWKVHRRGRQSLLERQAVEPCKGDIQDETPRRLVAVPREECLRGFERLHTPALGPQQSRQRLPNPGVVVHEGNENRRITLVHATPAEGKVMTKAAPLESEDTVSVPWCAVMIA